MAGDMKEHSINKKDNMFIKGYYIPHKIVDPFVELSKEFELTGGAQMTTDNDIKEWDGKEAYPKECFEYSITHPTCNDLRVNNLLDHIQIALEKYQDAYPLLRKQMARWLMSPTFNYQHYPKGKSYNGWHFERACTTSTRRVLVWMMYLNECEDGGETAFLYQKYKMKPEKGLVLFWPTDFTHTHRGMPSFKTEKKIITGWYTFSSVKTPTLAWL